MCLSSLLSSRQGVVCLSSTCCARYPNAGHHHWSTRALLPRLCMHARTGTGLHAIMT